MSSAAAGSGRSAEPQPSSKAQPSEKTQPSDKAQPSDKSQPTSRAPRSNKAQRQHRIARLLEEHRVTNQAHLVELLASDGTEVNVSTVSRDLEELGAIKVRIPGGETAYAVPELPKEQVAPEDHLRRVLGDWVVEVDRSGDLVVVRTPPGSAHVVGSALDRAGLPGVIGTIAGDDTLLLISTEGSGAEVAANVHDLAGLV